MCSYESPIQQSFQNWWASFVLVSKNQIYASRPIFLRRSGYIFCGEPNGLFIFNITELLEVDSGDLTSTCSVRFLPWVWFCAFTPKLEKTSWRILHCSKVGWKDNTVEKPSAFPRRDVTDLKAKQIWSYCFKTFINNSNKISSQIPALAHTLCT